MKPKPAKKDPSVRHERSAGVILFRTDPRSDQRLFLLLDYGRHWDYPKGHIEKGESRRAAAARELDEETGIRSPCFLNGFEKEIVYFFRKRRGLVRKTVVFFLACTSASHVRLSEEHVGYAWLPAEQALRRLTFPTARQVFEDAVRFLQAVPGRNPRACGEPS